MVSRSRLPDSHFQLICEECRRVCYSHSQCFGLSFPGSRAVAALRMEGSAGEGSTLAAWPELDDIAYGVLYLASDESKFITGTELIIDGGYTAQ